MVPSIKEIHRIPEVKPEPLGVRRRKGVRNRGRSTATAEPEPQQVLVYDPEEGWDDETDPHCKVLGYNGNGQELERREWLAPDVSQSTAPCTTAVHELSGSHTFMLSALGNSCRTLL